MFARLELELSGTEQVLDLGCGDGTDADWFARRARSTVGIDIHDHARWSTLARPGLRFQCADAQALPFPAGAFDLVFMKDVLHHALDPSRVLEEAGRVCAAGGRIYIVEGNRFNPVFYIHMTLMLGHQHFRRPVFRELVARRFPQARFVQFEAHVYPFSWPGLVRLAGGVETLVRVTLGFGGWLPTTRRSCRANPAARPLTPRPPAGRPTIRSCGAAQRESPSAP